jgi:O-antigen/teichoic acid export membrane protein
VRLGACVMLRPTAATSNESRFGVKRLYRDAGALATMTAANAVLGMGFWALAATTYPPVKLGVMTAVLAVVVSMGTVVAAGVGDAYTSLLPAVGKARHHLFRHGQRVFFVLALICGVAAAFVTTTLLREVRGSFAVGALITVGVVALASVALQNSTLVSLGRARWLPGVNIALSLGKILLLPLLAFTLSWHAVELSVVISALISVLVLRRVIARMIDVDDGLPEATMAEVPATRAFDRFVGQTIVSSALSIGLFMVTPFLVTFFGGAAQGAIFALSLSIVQVLDLVGVAMSMSLVVHASSSPTQAGAMARSMMIRAVLLAAVGGAVIVAVAPVVLAIINPEYGSLGARSIIAILSGGSVLRTVYNVWSALQRSRRKMVAQLLLNVASATILLAAMPLLCRSHGALGGAMSLILAESFLVAGVAGHYVINRHGWGWTKNRKTRAI